MECRKCGLDKQVFRRNRGKVCYDCEKKASRARTFKYIRGITYEERDEILARQGNVCAACSSPNSGSRKGWCVDHDHQTGLIRSVLCAPCNIALGMVNDSIQRLNLLIKYLELHGKGATTIPTGSTA